MTDGNRKKVQILQTSKFFLTKWRQRKKLAWGHRLITFFFPRFPTVHHHFFIYHSIIFSLWPLIKKVLCIFMWKSFFFDRQTENGATRKMFSFWLGIQPSDILFWFFDFIPFYISLYRISLSLSRFLMRSTVFFISFFSQSVSQLPPILCIYAMWRRILIVIYLEIRFYC